MTSPIPQLQGLQAAVLHDLVTALQTERISAPVTCFAVQQTVPTVSVSAAEELVGLINGGLAASHVGVLLSCVLAERAAREGVCSVELVTTGPDVAGRSRDTAVVVRELFSSARHRVSVVGFAVHQGRMVFAALASRMEVNPHLEVRLCLDIARRPGDTSSDGSILARFAKRFIEQEWPGMKPPKVYFDPRALLSTNGPRASLHAKCIVIDGDTALVGSANLTEAAQSRNIEMSLLSRSPAVATAIDHHIDTLIDKGHLRPLKIL